MKKNNQTKVNDNELLELGKKIRDFYDTGYVNKKQALWFSFLKGIMGGLGAVVGTTLVLALIVGLLSLFTNVPLLGRLFELVQEALSSNR